MSSISSLARPDTTLALAPARRPVTGLLLVGAGVLSAVGATWLSSALGWPDVLDSPGAEALPQFAASASAYRSAFYLMLLSSLLLIPAAIYLEDLIGGRSRAAVRSVTALGVLGAFAQLLGWVRWPVTVPHLSDAYAAASDETTRTAAGASYDVLNRYAGAALGEHLGWLLQGMWAVGVAVLLAGVVGIPRWFSLVGTLLALVWWPLLSLAGVTEAAWVNATGTTVYSVWFVWVLVLGLLVTFRRVAPRGAVADA
jgi:Domain of unknown function (DUF4386)